MFHFTRSSFSKLAPREYSDFHRNGFPHSDIPGSKVAWDLPEAYRTLRRPSSICRVKASTVRSLLRTTKTHNCAFCHVISNAKTRYNVTCRVSRHNSGFTQLLYTYNLFVNCQEHSVTTHDPCNMTQKLLCHASCVMSYEKKKDRYPSGRCRKNCLSYLLGDAEYVEEVTIVETYYSLQPRGPNDGARAGLVDQTRARGRGPVWGVFSAWPLYIR